MKYKKTPGSIVFDVVNTTLLIALAVVTLYPYLYVISASLSDPVELYRSSKFILLPKGFNLLSYKIVFKNPMLFQAYFNTITYVVLGTAINMIMNIFSAYTLSKKFLPGSKVIMKLIVFTMFFSGGMIPTFILVFKLGMIDTLWAMVLPNAVSAMNIIIMRTFFMGIDPAVEESASIDGANDITILFRIVLPLATPVIAVITLFYAVRHWNSFFDALLYLRSRTKSPLQLVLRDILISNDKSMTTGIYDNAQAVSENVKYALIVVSTLPILFLYPYLQKYFVKGIMVGSIK
jgi:putative aldouronate transport system permease protein